MIENHLSGKHFAYKASKRSRCVVCSKQISPTTGRRKDVKTYNYCPKCNVFLCFLVPASCHTTHVPLYSDCTDVFTILHVCIFQSKCVQNISTATRGCAELGIGHFDWGVW